MAGPRLVARGCAALIASILPAAVLAGDDFPTDREEADKFCEAIGETPNVAVPPRERMWFKDNCTCAGELGCGKIGSKRLSARLAAYEAAKEKKQAEAAATAARVGPAREATAGLRAAFWRCSDSPIAQDCNALADRLEAACKKHGLRTSWGNRNADDCYRQK
jgi:hypothetical protein